MTKSSMDKKFQKALSLVKGNMAVGAACRKAGIKYNTFHARMKTLKKKGAKIEEVTQAPNRTKKLATVTVEEVNSAFDRSLEALNGAEIVNDMLSNDSKYSVSDVRRLLRSVKEEIIGHLPV